jgi:choloylglycine hydrolase
MLRPLTTLLSLSSNRKSVHIGASPYGSSRVLEFLEGNTQGLQHRNTVGVLTNAPPFAWQLSSIGNYVGLAALDVAPITVSGTPFPPSGHGSGMRELPGESTPPSRFVRLLIPETICEAASKHRRGHQPGTAFAQHGRHSGWN